MNSPASSEGVSMAALYAIPTVTTARGIAVRVVSAALVRVARSAVMRSERVTAA